jgi:hypothetical protein
MTVDIAVLVSNCVSHALEMTINLYYPTLEFGFSFTQPFVYPTLFSSVPAPPKIMTSP